MRELALLTTLTLSEMTAGHEAEGLSWVILRRASLAQDKRSEI